MAYAPRFRAEMVTDRGEALVVSLEEDGYVGPPAPLLIGGESAVLDLEGLRGDRVYRPLLPTTARVEIAETPNLFGVGGLWAWLDGLDTYAARMVVTLDGAPRFVGWVEPAMEGRPLEASDYGQDLVVVGTCGLARLKTRPAPPIAPIPDGGTSVAAFIVAALREAMDGLDVYMSATWAASTMVEDMDVLAQVYLSEATRYGQSGYATSAETLLGEVCEALHLTVFQSAGAWHVIQRPNLNVLRPSLDPPGLVLEPMTRYRYASTSPVGSPADDVDTLDPRVVVTESAERAALHRSRVQPRLAGSGSIRALYEHGRLPGLIRNGTFDGADNDLRGIARHSAPPTRTWGAQMGSRTGAARAVARGGSLTPLRTARGAYWRLSDATVPTPEEDGSGVRLYLSGPASLVNENPRAYRTVHGEDILLRVAMRGRRGTSRASIRIESRPLESSHGSLYLDALGAWTPTDTTLSVPVVREAGVELSWRLPPHSGREARWLYVTISVVYDGPSTADLLVQSVEADLSMPSRGPAVAVSGGAWRSDEKGALPLDLPLGISGASVEGAPGGLYLNEGGHMAPGGGVWGWTLEQAQAEADVVALAELIAETTYYEQSATVRLRQVSYGRELAPIWPHQTMQLETDEGAILRTYQVTGATYNLVRGTWGMTGVPLASFTAARLTDTRVETED